MDPESQLSSQAILMRRIYSRKGMTWHLLDVKQGYLDYQAGSTLKVELRYVLYVKLAWEIL